MGNPLQILAISPGTGFHAPTWERVLGSGVDAFMLREPGMDARTLLEAARWCRQTSPGTTLWINGRLDVALAAGCGLHAPEAYPVVPDDLLPLSRPLHSEIQFDGRRQADQLLVSPLFDVPGKNEPWGPSRFHRFLDSLPADAPPIFALGGITPARLKELRHPRLSGVALIRALWETREPEALILQLRTAWAD